MLGIHTIVRAEGLDHEYPGPQPEEYGKERNDGEAYGHGRDCRPSCLDGHGQRKGLQYGFM